MSYINKTPSTCYICEEDLLEKNLKTLDRVQKEADVKILLALKGFCFPATFHLIKQYLHGVCASGLHEALLGSYEFGREVHTYSPAYKDSEIDTIAKVSHHLLFNSFAQLEKYKERIKSVNPSISIGLRINPECSTAPV